MRVCAVNGTNVACGSCNFAPAQSELLLRQHDDAAAFRRFVGQRAQVARRRPGRSGSTPGAGMKRRRHAIAERDRAGLIEQQHIHVARRFDGAAAHRQDIALQHAIHAAMPMALSSPPMVVGIRQTSSAISTGIGECRAGINAERLQRDADEQENERQRREQNRERDFVRRFLPFRAFDQRDHAVEKAVALSPS